MMCNICGIEYDTPSMGGPGICPRCDCGNLETGGIKRQQERIAALEAENARMKAALCMIYDKWEDGTPCYEDPEDYTGHLGNAVKLTDDEEAQILALIPSQRSAPETEVKHEG